MTHYSPKLKLCLLDSWNKEITQTLHKEMRKSSEHNPCNKVNIAEVKAHTKQLKE
jgi:hypothetical protein